MSFLAPLFLAGLAAVAIPILVHLTHRERREVVQFPSLMFLRRVPYRTVRRQRIRHWLLFLLRLAAIVLIVAAFARPLLHSATLAPVSIGTAREMVIALDRSYSMTAADRWERASEAADAAVDRLQQDDRATLVLFDDGAVTASTRTADRAVLHDLIARARPSAARTRFAPALHLARDLLEASDRPLRELVLITDFQRSGWEADPDLRLPDGTVLTPVDVGDDQADNIAVAGVRLQRDAGATPRLAVAARVVNASDRAATSLDVRLELDGNEVARRSIDVAAREPATVTFPAVPTPSHPVRGVVHVVTPGPDVDDRFNFTASPPAPVPLLLLHHPATSQAELLYLSQALRLGSEPGFALTTKPVNRFSAADLDGQAAVILFDVAYPSGSGGSRVEPFVRAGGGLFVILGPHAGAAPWPVAQAAWLGSVTGPVVDRLDASGGTFTVTDYGHPVFAPFARPRTGDFSQARVFRYRRLDPPAGSAVLGRFDDGAAALTTLTVGSGHVAVLATDLGNVWNDLPLQPVFLPFVHELARYVTRYRPNPAWRTAGEVLDLGPNPFAPPWGPVQDAWVGRLVAETPSGERQLLDEGGDQHLTLDEPGFYVVRPSDGSSTPQLEVAVNADVAEADLARLDPEEMVGAVSPVGGGAERAAALQAALTPAERERRQALWWYLLVGALLLLAGESIMAGRLSRTPRS
jgi:hypothetical protein